MSSFRPQLAWNQVMINQYFEYFGVGVAKPKKSLITMWRTWLIYGLIMAVTMAITSIWVTADGDVGRMFTSAGIAHVYPKVIHMTLLCRDSLLLLWVPWCFPSMGESRWSCETWLARSSLSECLASSYLAFPPRLTIVSLHNLRKG